MPGVDLGDGLPRPVLDSFSAEDQAAGEAGNNDLKTIIVTLSNAENEEHQRSTVHQAQQTSPASNLQFLLDQ